MKKYTVKQMESLNFWIGKKTVQMLLDSPYDFRLSKSKSVCKINGKVCVYSCKFKAGYAMKFHTISYKGKAIFSSTNLLELFKMIEGASKLFA